MDPIYDLLTTLGMRTPLMRFVGIGAITGGVLWLTKPKLFFDAAGKPRPWTLTDREKPADDATALPWYVASAGAGGIAAVFL